MKRKILQHFFLYYLALVNCPAWALVPFADNGSLLQGADYAVAVHNYGSYHREEKSQPFAWDAMVHLDHGMFFERSINMRYFLGAGMGGLQGGAFLKWVPFPDYKTQPALGASLGVGYLLNNFINTTAIQSPNHFVDLYFRPLVSKVFDTVIGELAPHFAVPLAVQVKVNDFSGTFPIQVVAGLRGELGFIQAGRWDYHIELGVGINSMSSSYINLGIMAILK